MFPRFSKRGNTCIVGGYVLGAIRSTGWQHPRSRRYGRGVTATGRNLAGLDRIPAMRTTDLTHQHAGLAGEETR